MIDSDYELEEKIHETSRTFVRRGRRRSDGARVVVKALQNDHPTHDELARFRREYELARSLVGDAVVRAYALERVGTRMAIVMEDTGATAVSSRIEGRRLGALEFLTLAVPMAGALAEVHRQRVIHKDINPSNFVVTERGDVKIIDFGISTLLPRETTVAASPDVLEGTLAYLSPEQTGRVHHPVDYRTDLYALGVSFYEMLTGALPFRAEGALAMVHAHIAATPAPPHEVAPDVPEALSRIVLTLLAKSPDDRYQSAQGLRADLADCEARLRSGDPLDTGGPARPKISDRFLVSQRLYGREAQLAELLSAFERARRGPVEVLLVAGYSGVGKSALVGEIQRSLAGALGHFVAGKFDQLHRDTPYASIREALRALVRQILGEGEARFLVQRARLAEAVGQNGQVVVDLIPEVERILGPQPPIAPLPPAESQNRHDVVFRRFVCALATPEHPVALFLDDLQWADAPSLGLLAALALDPELRHLLIIGAYRENEVPATHPLAIAIAGIQRGGGRVTTLPLAPLGAADVHRLVADTLSQRGPLSGPPGSDDERTLGLSELAFEKTHGNPFFLGQFLRALHDARLLERDEDGAWRWDLDAIQRQGITDNVVELMADKIKRLADDAREVLVLAACIGARFDLGTLAVISERSPFGAAAALWEPLQEGLLLTNGLASRLVGPDGPSSLVGRTAVDLTFDFLHDRVQQAAYSLIEPASRQDVHLRIGRLLVRGTPPSRLEERVFDVVHHLGLGLARMTDPAERLGAARLFLLAGRKAKLSAAHEPAARYLRAGISVLPADAALQHHALALDLHVEAMEAEVLNARFDDADALGRAALSAARTPLDEARVHEARALIYSSQMKLDEAIVASRAALASLGVELPVSADDAAFMAGLVETQTLLGGRSTAELLALPEGKDERYLATMRILLAVAASAYQRAPAIFPLLVFRLVELSVRHGNSAYSTCAYADYGLLLGILGDAEAANAYGDLAHAVLDRFQANPLRAKVFFVTSVFIRPWKIPLRETYTLALEALRAGMDHGDNEYACWAATQCARVPLGMGDPLDAVSAEIGRLVEMGTRLRHEAFVAEVSIYRGLALTLAGATDDPTHLPAEDATREAFRALGFVTGLCILEICACQLAYLAGDLDAAMAAAERAEAAIAGVRGFLDQTWQNLFQSLSLLAAPCAGDERAARLAKVDRNQAELARWAAAAPMNYRHTHDFVEAERLRVLGRHGEAMDLYERAIEGASRNGFVHHEALASELAGAHQLALGRARLAEHYLREAHRGYVRWGARVKVAALERRHATIEWRAGPPSSKRAPGTTIATGRAEAIDLVAVMNAAQAISGEIVLDRLVDRLMKIALASAGAQRAVLLFDRYGDLVVRDEQLVGDREALCRRGASFQGEPHLPHTILNYVVRTGEAVLLNDARAAGDFAADPYIVAGRAKSILCAPLLHQGRRLAVVYLENGLTEGAFTESRVEVLRMLGAQAVLSIQNAMLYESLEQKVEERTAELRATQGQLIIQEKLASLGALTAGIAHELKNPLNFVNNFAQLSTELLGEALEDHAAGAGDLRATLETLRENASVIEHHAERASSIIDGMLLHSHRVRAPRQTARLNALVAEGVVQALDVLRAADPGLSVSVTEDYDGAVGEISVVPADVQRVVANLLSNAAHATAQKRKTAPHGYAPEIAVRTRSLRGARVEIAVRDNGAGIPAAILDRIYDPFFTTKPSGEGTGLGLSICHDIVTQGHHGEIRVNSVEGEGAELVVTLPRAAG